MLETKTKEKLADAARTLAASYELVVHNEAIYLPVDYLTGVSEPLPDIERRSWLALDRTGVQRFGNTKANILFANESEVLNFEGMLKQISVKHDSVPPGILLTTDNGLMLLDESGKLVPPDGRFVPNHITTPLITDPAKKDVVFGIVKDWLGGEEEETHSLLHHLATALAPQWSAVKYVLLLGEGRNGKSVLLQMLTDLLGRENVSSVSRQQMAEQSSVCVDLNGSLANIVMDGSMEYLKDSGMEKTLIAGETGWVRPLYVSRLVSVQTNGLFLEALNQEPKTRDKSSALQKRIVRYRFPNVYELNPQFARSMRRPDMLGAFLALLLDHYVIESEAAVKLAPTKGAIDLQLDQLVLNSIVHQFLLHLYDQDEKALDKLIGTDVMPLVNAFTLWAINQDSKYSDRDALEMFKRSVVLKRSTRRNQVPKNYWRIEGWKPETAMLIAQLNGE